MSDLETRYVYDGAVWRRMLHRKQIVAVGIVVYDGDDNTRSAVDQTGCSVQILDR